MSLNTEYFDILQRSWQSQQPFVVVTLVDVIGSAPQNAGARMLVGPQGRIWGTVGGGKVENHALQFAQGLLQAPQKPVSVFKEWNLQTEIGMTCGGVSRFYFELFVHNHWNIAIFGAGHVAQALVRVLLSLDCRLWVIDSRQEWLDPLPESPALTRWCAPQPAERVQELPKDCFVVSMTMGHAHDVPILTAVFGHKAKQPEAFPFVGVIGSHAKAGVIAKDLKQQGVPQHLREQLVCPLGLPLGSNSPPEIAISISAQLLQERDRIFATHQKWQKPVHQRKMAKGSQAASAQALPPENNAEPGLSSETVDSTTDRAADSPAPGK